MHRLTLGARVKTPVGKGKVTTLRYGGRVEGAKVIPWGSITVDLGGVKWTGPVECIEVLP